MQKVSISPKLTLVFGLDWVQHDPLGRSLHKQIGLWKEEGYKYAAHYSDPGGQVFGLYRPMNDQVRFDKTCISGAAILATHPQLVDKTAIVLIEFREPDGENKVIFVGLRDSKVLMDFVITPDQIQEQRNVFRSLHAAGKDVETFGELSGGQRVDHVFTLDQLTPVKGGGKACPVAPLRSSHLTSIIWGSVALVLIGTTGYFVWQYQLDSAADLKRRMALKEQTPQVLYANEIARWAVRPINLVSPSVEFLHAQLRSWKFAKAGWILTSVSCLGEQCTSRWHRDVGTLDEFRAAAPLEWKLISASGQDDLDVVMEFKLPIAHMDRTLWPKFSAVKDKLVSHWQYLHAVGWRAELGEVKQLAIPVSFTTEQRNAVANFENAPRGVEVKAEAQSWAFAAPDPKGPLQAHNFAEQVELTEPIVVKYDGKSLSFSFKGIIYVSSY